MMFATIDSAGHVTGFYSSDIHPVIPPDAIELTLDQWQQWAVAPNMFHWANGALVAASAPPPATVTPPTLKQQAQMALAHSDIVMGRCVESAVTVPAEWKAWRVALRAIVSGVSSATALPAMPGYPAGT